MASKDELWHRILQNKDLSFVGFVNPNQVVFDEDDPKHLLIELWMSKKPLTGDRKAIKVRVSIKLLSKDGSTNILKQITPNDDEDD